MWFTSFDHCVTVAILDEKSQENIYELDFIGTLVHEEAVGNPAAGMSRQGQKVPIVVLEVAAVG
jgi:hypothetical protein